jgi:hypothetical protein
VCAYLQGDVSKKRISAAESLKVKDYKYALDESSIVAYNQKGIITYVNNFCQISKYSREELIGQDHQSLTLVIIPKFIGELWTTIT